ncbi:sulfatase [Paucihalobacter ruber]|uniref:Sulfatase n=1 Tax=Paucihalobacter ruber TaxID=2567861 RepID=A0A506PQN3_9FLAO|nr:sulfatase [Paucihalobacter ruber]TPV35577.1 sulfatase [Paucihalobacter ruber]
MKYILLLSCVLTLITSCQSPEEVQKPNILIIYVDDLGISDLGYTGSTFYESPNIDRLASKGTIFTQGYANSRVCSPSRASILTGKFTARHGITDWIGAKTGTDWRSLNRHDKMLPADYVMALNLGDTTLAEVLKSNGYNTFYSGKWHLGDEGSFPEDHGFDINIAGIDKGSPPGGYFSPFKNPKLEDKEPGENLTIRLAQETVNFITTEKDKPFFAFLSFYAVHGPIQTTQDKWNKYREKAENMGIQDSGFVMEKKLPIRQVQDNPIYAGLVETMDDAVGIVLEALETSGLDKNTIVIFTSDNGGVSSGDNFSTSNLPFKGGKGYHWEGGIREPFIVYVPWLNSNPKTIDTPVTAADLYPTILDFAKIQLMPNQHQDGMSLKLMMEGNSNLPERPLYWHYPHYGNQGGDPSSVVRLGDWKLIHLYETGENLLFNLKTDPFESQDVAQTNPELTLQLEQQLLNWLQSVNAKFPIPDSDFNIEERIIYDNTVATKRKQQLEQQRKNMLTKDFKPNEDWWGSQVTKD